MLGTPSPPSDLVWIAHSHAIVPFFPPHMKPLMFFSIWLSCSMQIPSMVIRYSARDTTSVLATPTLPIRDGYEFDHSFMILSCFSMISSHLFDVLMWFPCHEPRIRMASPSLAIFAPSGRGFPFNIRVALSSVQKAGDPTGMISVFSQLNFAVDALQKTSMQWNMMSKLSFCLGLVRMGFAIRSRDEIALLSVRGVLLCVGGQRRPAGHGREWSWEGWRENHFAHA
jgi:hypothetical protein